jgi:uncharacterized protein (TIGR00369 family)
MKPTVQEEVLKSMLAMEEQFKALGIALVLPPPSSKVLGTTYVEVDLGKTLTAEFKFNPEFTNPIKTFHGGFLTAAFDDVCGPLTYMAAQRPAVTLEMSTSFIRPFTAKDEVMRIRGEVISQTKSILILKAEARTREGKLLAIFQSNSMILSDLKLKIS